MVVRRCPQCGSTADDQYGFCIKCGHEFSKITQNENTCPLCGYMNPDEADFCVKCGTPLLFKNRPEGNNAQVRPIVIKKEVLNNPQENVSTSRARQILIILGYVFSVLGGLLGLIIAIYLSTRKDPVSKKHGHVQLAIFGFYILLIVIFILTGAISMDTLQNYTQLISGNLTSFNR